MPLTLFLSLLLLGCSSAGVTNVEYAQFDKTTVVSEQIDDVWGYILEWSAVKGIPIGRTDKDSGIIVLEFSGTVSQGFGSADIDERLVSCGEATGNIGLYTGQFTDLLVNATVILRAVDGGTRVTVNLSGNVGVEVRNGYGTVSQSRNTCASRGVLEKALFADLREF